VDLPIEHGDFPHSYVKLAEGIPPFAAGLEEVHLIAFTDVEDEELPAGL